MEHPKFMWSRSTLVAVLLISAAITLLYAPLFDGYWLGDDFTNLLIGHQLAGEGELLRGTFEYFFKGTSSAGTMYRPLQMASLLGNYALAGDYYPAWFAVNFALHLINTILVFQVVRIFAVHLNKTGRLDNFLSPLLAALAFALAPALAEGIFFVSARADALVTLLSLLSLFVWARSMKTGQEALAWWFPVLLIPALLTKESAAVLPLQMILVTAALWPAVRRQHLLALSASILLLCGFFALRWSLFDQFLGVYSAPGESVGIQKLSALWAGFFSLKDWWHALTHATPVYATAYLGLTGAALIGSILRLRGPSLVFVLALLSAAGGYVLATLLNVGGLQPTGEGGRLSYGPVCWFMLAVGVAMTVSVPVEKSRWLVPGLLAASVLCGGLVLYAVVSQVSEAQKTTRGIADGVSIWSATHNGHGILFIPEMAGFVVATRNAQGSLVMPPVQASGYLHRLMPTLENELPERYKLYQNGLATRLLSVPPGKLDALTIENMFKTDTVRWPDYYLCWSITQSKILTLNAPRTTTIDTWTEDLRKSLAHTCFP